LVTQKITTIEKHVLQIGCGSKASWGIDVASQHSKWIVIGIDDEQETEYIQQQQPKNFKFISCNNLLQGLNNLPDHTFDFIASRFLILDYTAEEYQQLISECIRLCRPGGFIEVMEMDLRIYHQRLLSSSVTHLLNTEVIKVIESKSLDPRLARRLQDLVIDPISSTQVKYISLPLGVWGGKLGVMFRDDVHSLIEAFQKDVAEYKEKNTRTEDELDYKMDIMDNEMDSNHAFMNLHLMVIHV
jgi:SAM-dependent methyltransferase